MRDAFLVDEPRSTALRAANYSRELNSLSRSRRGHFRATPLRELLTALGQSYGNVFTRIDCSSEHGVELVSQTDMFASEPAGRVIRLDSMPRPELHRILRWQVLIAGAGQTGEGTLFGRSIIADGRLANRFVGGHAVQLTFENSGGADNLWTYAFLNTRPGIRAIKSCAFGTSVPGLRLDLLGALVVPIPEDNELLARAAALVRNAVEKRDVYFTEVHAARDLIRRMPVMQQAESLCAEHRCHSVVWSGPIRTLTARTYASTGGALPLLARTWSATLREVLEDGGAFNGPRFTRILCEAPYGVDFYSQRDVFMMRPMPRRIVRPQIDDRLLFVPAEAILAGSHGQVAEGSLFGKVELASFSAGAGLTQDLLRLLFRPEHRAVAYAYLSTGVGERLLRATAVGTSIPSMRLDLLLDLPFPTVSPDVDAQLRRHLGRAESARIEARKSEAEAIEIVEEALSAWLD